MKTYRTAEDAAQPLRENGYRYLTSTDAFGNVVELYDPSARNHIFEDEDGTTRQVSFHEGVYYNIPAGTKVVTTLVEEKDGDKLFHIGFHGAGDYRSPVYKTKAKNRTHAIAKVADSLGVKPSGYFKHIRKPSQSQQSFAQDVDNPEVQAELRRT